MHTCLSACPQVGPFAAWVGKTLVFNDLDLQVPCRSALATQTSAR
jgi:hypothetical protein